MGEKKEKVTVEVQEASLETAPLPVGPKAQRQVARHTT